MTLLYMVVPVVLLVLAVAAWMIWGARRATDEATQPPEGRTTEGDTGVTGSGRSAR